MTGKHGREATGTNEANAVSPMKRIPCPAARGAAAPGWCLLVAAALAALASPVHATTYKWVDEKGVVHYTDKIPADAVNKGSTVLDKQARPVKKIDPALTPEQVRAREAEEEQRRLAARLAEEVARRDRALVASYTTEAEIDLARTRSLATIDAQLESAQAYVASLRKRKDELEKRRSALGEQPVPVALERELDGANTELGKQARLIAIKQQERAAVIARYDADKQRWRELRAIAEATEAAGRNPALHPAASGNLPARK
jgi:hypothetical protein